MTDSQLEEIRFVVFMEAPTQETALGEKAVGVEFPSYNWNTEKMFKCKITFCDIRSKGKWINAGLTVYLTPS